MATGFQEVQQVQQDSGAQFQQTQAVTESGGGFVQGANLVASLFGKIQQSGADKAANAAAEKEKAGSNMLISGLAKLSQNSLTDPTLNLQREQKIFFNKLVDQGVISAEAGAKHFKATTGFDVAGRTAEQQAKFNFRVEHIGKGWGDFGSSPEFNEAQGVLYSQHLREDAEEKRKIQKANIQKSKGEMDDREHKKIVVKAFQKGAGTLRKKVANDAQDWVRRWELPEGHKEKLTTQQVKERVAAGKRAVASEVATLGEFGQDPIAVTLTTPILNELKWASDVANKVIDSETAKKVAETNMNIGLAAALSNTEVVADAVRGEIYQNSPGVLTEESFNAVSFINAGMFGDKLATFNASGSTGPKPKAPQLPDPREYTEKDRREIEKLVDGNFSENASPIAKREMASSLVALVTHLERNGIDYEEGDMKFVMHLLSKPNAMDVFTEDQKQVVRNAFGIHLRDKVDAHANSFINRLEVLPSAQVGSGITSFTGATEGSIAPTTLSRIGVTPSAKKGPMTDFATLVVKEGHISWEAKEAFLGNGQVRVAIQKANNGIRENITKAVQVVAKARGTSFEEAAKLFLVNDVLPEELKAKTEEVGGDGAKKTNSPDVGGDVAGKAPEAVLNTSSKEGFTQSILPVITQEVSGTGIFPEVAAAQAILESGWGKEVKGGNFFGIKGEGQTITTHEVVDGKRVKIEDEFRTFSGFSDSVRGYKEFLQSNPRYAEVLKSGSPEEQAQALQDAGYATDPDYAKKLISIMRQIREGK